MKFKTRALNLSTLLTMPDYFRTLFYIKEGYMGYLLLSIWEVIRFFFLVTALFFQFHLEFSTVESMFLVWGTLPNLVLSVMLFMHWLYPEKYKELIAPYIFTKGIQVIPLIVLLPLMSLYHLSNNLKASPLVSLITLSAVFLLDLIFLFILISHQNKKHAESHPAYGGHAQPKPQTITTQQKNLPKVEETEIEEE